MNVYINILQKNVKFSFVKEWRFDTVRLIVIAKEGDWEQKL